MEQQHDPKSNVGKWNDWYADLHSDGMGAFRYGGTVTYRMAAAFMADVAEVEDWGCGAGGFQTVMPRPLHRCRWKPDAVADRIVDLCEYSSNVEGIVMRHVLEHNEDWQRILNRALRSFTRKFCLILFTPFSETTHQIAYNAQHGVDVPDISFRRSDIEDRMVGLRWELFESIPTESGYGIEHVYLVWRPERATSSPARLPGSLDRLKAAFRGPRRAHAPRRAVYTAIFGGYDEPKKLPPGIDEDVDFICFTDDSTLEHPQWRVRHVPSAHQQHPRLAAKYYKAMPHAVLSEYDETIWVGHQLSNRRGYVCQRRVRIPRL